MEVPAPAESPEGVSFLTALLVRYPEIGSACLRQGGRALRLDFYLTCRLEEDEVQEFEEHVQLSWEVFFMLQRVRPELAAFQRSEARRGEVPWMHDDEDGPLEVDSIQFLRDVQSVSVEEIALLVGLVRERFADDLALNEEAPGDEPAHPGSVLATPNAPRTAHRRGRRGSSAAAPRDAGVALRQDRPTHLPYRRRRSRVHDR